MNDNRILMGKRIKERRKLVNLSQTQLGEKIGVTFATISKYESGEIKSIDATILNNIAKITETDVNYFLLNTNNPNLKNSNNENLVKDIDKKMQDNDIVIAANSKVDLGKLAKADSRITRMINILLDDFENDDDEEEE